MSHALTLIHSYSPQQVTPRRVSWPGVLLTLLALLCATAASAQNPVLQTGTPYVGPSGKTVICQFVDSLTLQPVTVTIGSTLVNNGYKVGVTPTSAVACR